MIYTKEMDEWLVEISARHLLTDIVKMFNDKFETYQTRGAIQQHLAKLGIKPIDGRNAYTEEQLEWFRNIGVENYTYDEVYAMMKEQFPEDTHTRGGLEYILNTNDMYCKSKERWAWNKGMTFEEMAQHSDDPEWYDKFMNAQGRARKGEYHTDRNGNPIRKPLGHEQIDHFGYTLVKVKDDVNSSDHDDNKNYTPKQRVVYEQLHGPIPEGYCVIFLNQDRTDFSPDNLVCVPKGYRALINQSHSNLKLTDDVEMNKAILAYCDLMFKIKEAKNNE